MKARFAFPLALALAGCTLAACGQKPPEPGPSVVTPPIRSASPETTPSSSPSVSPAETPASSPKGASSEPDPDRPHFANQSANEFAERYDAFIVDFKLAYEAMKNRDMSKYEAVIARAQELEINVSQLESELSPEDQKKFADYLRHRADELAALANAK